MLRGLSRHERRREGGQMEWDEGGERLVIWNE